MFEFKVWEQIDKHGLTKEHGVSSFNAPPQRGAMIWINHGDGPQAYRVLEVIHQAVSSNGRPHPREAPDELVVVHCDDFDVARKRLHLPQLE